MVHGHAEQALDRLLRQLVAAKGVGVIDFIVAMPLNGHTRITRYREQGRLGPRRVQRSHHERVTAPHIVRAAVHAHNHHMYDIARDLVATGIYSLMALLQAKIHAQPYYRQEQQHGKGPPNISIRAPFPALPPHDVNLPSSGTVRPAVHQPASAASHKKQTSVLSNNLAY